MRPGAFTARRDAGSAYLVVLLALVVLTLLGLSLALLTQTERQIGANELVVQRVLYAADSGVAAAAARALAAADYRPLDLTLPAGSAAGATFEHRVDVSPFLPIGAGYCNLCSINQGSEFYQVIHGVTADAIRQGRAGGGDPVEQARKVVSVMVAVQPWELRIVDLTAAEIAQVKF